MSRIASSGTEAALKASAEAAAKASAEAAAKASAAVSEAAAKSSGATTARAAAKVARKSADDAMALARKAAAEGAEGADDAAALMKKAKNAEALAKSADDAAAAAEEAAEAAVKSADDAADASKSAAKNADDLAAGAGKSGKGTSEAMKAAAMLGAGALVAGGVLYIDKELRDADEKIKDCMKVCLPENWDDYVYGENIEESELKYKEIDEDMGEQPLCNERIKDCADFCEDKCTELHEADLPGGGIADQFVKSAEKFFKYMNPFKGIGDIASMVVGGFLLFLIIGGVAFILFKIISSRRSRESATNSV